MFKTFFKKIYNGFTNVMEKIKKSTIGCIAGKIIKGICKASVVVTAFNAGNIMESVSHLSNAPTTIFDTARWMTYMCKDWIEAVKHGEFTWDIREIFIPLVIAVMYVGGNAISFAFKGFKFITKRIKNSHRTKVDASQEDVVDVFAM